MRAGEPGGTSDPGGYHRVRRQSRTDTRRWRLQIQLRGPSAQPQPRTTVAGVETDRVIIEQSEVDTAIAAIRDAFAAPASAAGSETGPARSIKRLEELIDVLRDQWPPQPGAWWEPVRDAAHQRLKSPQHELRWFNLAGFALRPGRGFPLDEIRLKSLWPVFHQGVKHTRDVQCWAEWWILWRRVAAGLSRQHHDEIHRRLAPFVVPAKGTSPSKKAGRPKPEPHELAETRRRRQPGAAGAGGQGGIGQLAGQGAVPAFHSDLSALVPGPAGCRVPLYGLANTVVRREAAERRVDALLSRTFAPGRETSDAIFALSQLARSSGDRARDLPEELRHARLEPSRSTGADESILRPVREYHELEAAQESIALGDALPIGLRLREESPQLSPAADAEPGK